MNENDNNGRRHGIRNLLSNDPLYRRVKDAVLVIVALVGGLQMMGVDMSAFVKTAKADDRASDKESYRSGMLSRMSNVETRLAGLEATMASLEKKGDKIEDKIDRLLISRAFPNR